MPTPSEQKALAFVAIVIVLGGGVRLLRAGAPVVPSVAEQEALARQASAAESAANQPGRGRRSGRGAKVTYKRRDGGAQNVPGAAGDSSGDERSSHPPRVVFSPRTGPVAYPPPLPRIDVDNRPNRSAAGTAPLQPGRGGETAGRVAAERVDLDLATASEIEALPRIGPTLAARIVANRDSLGPFHTIEGLARVKGMGPAMRRAVAPLVTFSGRPASFNVRGRY